jgi:hypothetical protein
MYRHLVTIHASPEGFRAWCQSCHRGGPWRSTVAEAQVDMLKHRGT